MVFVIIMIVTLIAFVAEIGLTEEPFERIATVIVFAFFEEMYDIVLRGGSSVNHHVRWIDGAHFDLVVGQDSLKLLEFSDTAWNFRDSS